MKIHVKFTMQPRRLTHLVLLDGRGEGLIHGVDELQRIYDALEDTVQTVALLGQPLIVQVRAGLFDGHGHGQKLDYSAHLQ